jgi:Tol biopolymer transport system component
MPLQSGSRLGPYELTAPIGAGGMGEVWRGKDTRLDRSVAVKILPAAVAEDEDRRERFSREARTVSSLNHPHICTLFDVGHEGDIHYLVMELLEGESLADRLARGPLPLDQVVRLGAQVADALDAAHRQGVVHRDLKPANVVVTKTGAKLLDFGLARPGTSANGSPDSTELPTEVKPLTSAGTVIGTFQYMAPEQLEGREADSRTDVFALGALLYEMATGRRAFPGQSKPSLIAAILTAQPPAVSSLLPVTPPAFDHVVRRCLAKDPDDRWQSARDVASELRWIGEGGSQAGAPATAPARRRGRLGWALGAAAALVAVFLLRDPARPAPAVQATLDPPPETSLAPFDELGVALSPDGRQIAFVAIGSDGSRRIWVRDLAGRASRPLPETSGAGYPFWSPDGRQLGFFADGKLKRIDLRGGAPLVVADASSGRGGSWSRDDVILFSPSLRTAIHRVPAGGGTPAPVTRFDPETEVTHRWPLFLPSGRHFLYLSRARVSGQPERGRLMLASLDTPGATTLVEDATNAAYVAPGFLLYGRAGNLYAWRFDAERRSLFGQPAPVVEEKLSVWEAKNLAVFAASDSGTVVYLPEAAPKTALQWYDPGGRPLGSLGAPGFYRTPRVSPDGRQVAYFLSESSQAPGDLWIMDLQYERPFRLTQASGRYSEPAWSRDGARLAFVCQPKAVQDLCVKTLAGGGEVELLHESPFWKSSPSWMPDGRSLAFAEQDPKTLYDLRVLDLGAEPRARPYLQTPSSERFPAVSPDGRWIAHVTDETGRLEVVLRPASGSHEQWPVSTGGGTQPRWRGDGREVYYASAGGYLEAVAIETQPAVRPGTPRRLFRLPERPDRDMPIFADVTPDGRRFLLNVPVAARSSVGFHLILNWPSLLDRRGE